MHETVLYHFYWNSVTLFSRASASRVTAILPYYGYARQVWQASPRLFLTLTCCKDEKTKPRVPIAASDVAMLLEAGVRVSCLDVDR